MKLRWFYKYLCHDWHVEYLYNVDFIHRSSYIKGMLKHLIGTKLSILSALKVLQASYFTNMIETIGHDIP